LKWKLKKPNKRGSKNIKMDNKVSSLDIQELSQDKLEFLNKFWGISWRDKDIQKFKGYLNTKRLNGSGKKIREISKLLNLPEGTISKWIYRTNLPLIVRLAEVYSKFENLRGYNLLSLNSTRGGLFTGPWIKVSNKINRYEDILQVTSQIPLLPDTYKKAEKFSVSKNFLENNKDLFFAYLLGIMIGDAGKHGFKRSNRFIRRISLKLSKKYESNKRLGEFVGLCVNALGMKYSQCRDVPPSKKNKFYFYSWNSQSSLLISWIMEACFGLGIKDRTSYNPIKAEWILNSPKKFKVWFLQGVADSDGYIDINTFQAGIVSKPNIRFIQKVLDSLNIDSKRGYLHKGSLFFIRFNLRDAYKLPIFNPYVKLYRYNLMEKLINSEKFNSHWPKWLGDEVDNYIREGFSSTKIMHLILNKYNIAVRAGGIGKRIRKFKMAKERKVILGIESTAL